MNLGSGVLDGALIVMSYHDLYVVDLADNWPAIDARQFIDQIVVGLKPGGVKQVVSSTRFRGFLQAAMEGRGWGNSRGAPPSSAPST